MSDEMTLAAERLRRIQQTSQTLSDTAAALKEVADQLRADVDLLSLRMDDMESGAKARDVRLDDLEK